MPSHLTTPDHGPGQDQSVGTLVAASLNPLDVAIVNDQFPFLTLSRADLAAPQGRDAAQARGHTLTRK